MDLLDLRADQRAAAAKNEKLGEMYVFASRHVKCTRCGLVPRKADTVFFKKNDSPVYSANNGRICICKSCAQKIFEAYAKETNDPLYALMQFCAEFNYYYDKEVAIALYDNGTLSLGRYIAKINTVDRGKTFADNFASVVSTQREEPAVLEQPTYNRTTSWAIEDKKNKDNVSERIGYDPFIDGGFSDEQLKFLYNTCAGYLTDAVEQDPHKLQNVVLMCKTFLQLETIDKMLNNQFNSVNPDTQLIASLTATKEKLTNTITRIANENGFAEKTSGRSNQGSNTLSFKMREMEQKHFEFSKVNIHDVRMAESFKEIAKINAHALMDELAETGDDFARLCADQRQFVVELQEENDELTEQNRLLNIRIKDLEEQIKAKAR